MYYIQLAFRGKGGSSFLDQQLFGIIWNDKDQNNKFRKADQNPAWFDWV